MKVIAVRFKNLPINQKFIAVKTWEYIKKVYLKTENRPSKYKWAIYSNALMPVEGNKMREIYFLEDALVVPESEFHKLGIK